MQRTLILAAAALSFAAVQTHAQDVGQHPAVFAPRSLPAVDPSTFIVAHPAQLSFRAGHANYEHPAVVTWRAAAQPHLDTNAMLVQPPASTQWTLHSDEQPAPVVARAAVHAG